MLVSQILKDKGDLVFTASPQETVGAAAALLHSRRVGAMVIVDADEAVVGILKAVDLPVQLGGGIRDLDTVERYLDDGIRYVIIGTAAVKNPGFLRDRQEY